MSITPISDQKQELRKQCKAIRKDLGEDVRRQASAAICAQLVNWDVFQQAEVILTYMPMRTEVDLRPLLAEFPEKRWLLPRILPGKDGQMVFHPYAPEHLIQHSFGMAEPAPYLLRVSPDDVELVLTPGLAFDRSGWRLGYGGGFYDRFLSAFRRTSIGIVFQALLFKDLPRGEYDVPMGWVMSESEFFNVQD